jgi:NADH-quinone oxidoreductase subunit B
MIKLQEKIDKQSIRKVNWYSHKKREDANYVPEPILGPDLIDPRRYGDIRLASVKKEGA